MHSRLVRGTKTSTVQPKLSFKGTNKKIIIIKGRGGPKLQNYFDDLEKIVFFKTQYTKAKNTHDYDFFVGPHLSYKLGFYPFKAVFVLVVPSKLTWGYTFENFMSGVACLIYQYGPNYWA